MTPPADLDMAVQALVDHDTEDQNRARKRWALIAAVVDGMKQRGHYPSIDGDPIVFRCGDVIVTAQSDRDVRWQIITRLKERD
jgi:hypothetical protein